MLTKARVLPSKKANAGVHSREERGNELYPTPSVATQALLTQTGEHIPSQILEPMCGMGHMAIPLRETGRSVICSDIEDYGWEGQDAVLDFFSIDPGEPSTRLLKSYDCIVTNPAFSQSNAFVRHALKLVNKVIILNRLAFLESEGRSDIITGHLTRFYPFVERLPMMHRWSKGEDGIWREWAGKKAPSATPHAWYVFERHKPLELGDGFIGKRISWRAAA